MSIIIGFVLSLIIVTVYEECQRRSGSIPRIALPELYKSVIRHVLFNNNRYATLKFKPGYYFGSHAAFTEWLLKQGIKIVQKYDTCNKWGNRNYDWYYIVKAVDANLILVSCDFLERVDKAK